VIQVQHEHREAPAEALGRELAAMFAEVGVEIAEA
jgi:hypothetical protein